MAYTVYQHISPSGKSYIGITKQNPEYRWRNGENYKSSPHFYSAIRKYGWENFEHIILYEGLTKEEACACEQYHIKELNTTNREFGYNDRAGGEVGALFNDETRRKQRDAVRAYWAKPENRQKAKGRNLGRKMSDEARANMSKSKQGIKLPPHTEEWKRLMSEIMRHKVETDPRWLAENAERLREIGKRKEIGVVQLTVNWEFVAEYENAHAAQKATGISNGNIRRVCNGKGHLAGGYRWLNTTDYISQTEKSLIAKS